MNWALFIIALTLTESDGQNGVVGDHHLQNKAYGVLQIRKPYLDDVNRIAGTHYTLEEVRRSPTISRWCVVTYVRHYGKRYTRLTGKPLTMEVGARLHNGGPNGWKKTSTDKHWARFQVKIREASK
jgi:hypothetical protein